MDQKGFGRPVVWGHRDDGAFGFMLGYFSGCDARMGEDYDKTGFDIKGGFDCTT